MVRFADKLASNRVVEWSDHYVDYDGLKKLLKKIERKLIQLDDPNPPAVITARESSLTEDTLEKQPVLGPSAGGPSFVQSASYGAVDQIMDRVVNAPDPDEEFFDAIKKEASKVEAFYDSKCQELSERLEHARESVKRLRDKYTSSALAPPLSPKRGTSTDDGGYRPGAYVPDSPSTTPLKRVRSLYTNTVGGNGDHSESDDEGENLNRDLHARASLKRSFVDIYRHMNYLLNFSSLNYTAFVKIIKKHDKVTKRNSKRRAMAIVQSYAFCESLKAKELVDDLERLFAAAFHNRNLTVARNDLLTKNRPADSLEMLHLGFRFGVVVTLFFWVLWVIAIDALVKPAVEQISASVFIVYRGLSTMILGVWLWALCLYVWESARVNYIFLFEFDPRDYATPFSVARRASTMTIVFLTNMLLFIKIARSEFLGVPPSTASALPFALFGYVAFMALYTRLGGSGASALRYVVASPFVEVTFFHSFVADVMTSMVRPFVDIAFSLCFFFSGEWRSSDLLHVKDASGSICMNSWTYQNLIVPFVISLPLWFRFAQCLRRYYDTGKRIPNLLNATKYAIAYTVVLFGALHPSEGSEQSFHRAWYVSAATSTLITFFWDVYMDWGLFKNKGFLLRERLMYPTWAYVAAIAADLVLRFIWTLTLFPSVAAFFAGGAAPGLANADYSPLSMYLTALLSWAEVSRRCMWAFFRVEHEHLTNAFGFRRVDFVPLHFDSPLDHDSDDVRKRMSTINKLGFFTELFVFLALFLSVAIFTFNWQVSTSPYRSGTLRSSTPTPIEIVTMAPSPADWY